MLTRLAPRALVEFGGTILAAAGHPVCALMRAKASD
jgi:hypothetical protein